FSLRQILFLTTLKFTLYFSFTLQRNGTPSCFLV
ncbi:MAG: hypothetical protein ACI84C_002419, partial [Flavobacteriales bacterium]